ncbi:hypothetical protein EDC04DRAFT_2601541 [Pisolithus marmoratus]|nr:hypothetical protein EDC04DRAFT_2601541 [Pisolithus marmoratus]
MLLPMFALASLAAARGDRHLPAREANGQSHVEMQEYPQVPLTPPHQPLVWGDFNVIHTTDTHGWLLGHQRTSFPEPHFSGDLGDFATFVAHMKFITKASSMSTICAFRLLMCQLQQKGVDLLLVDSGDLHDGTGLSDEYESFIPHFEGRYLMSNVNITIFNSDGEAVSVPVGNRYTKFTTAMYESYIPRLHI